MSRVLVTGASGFIGSRLVQVLQEYDYELRAVFRRLPTSDKPLLCEQQIAVGEIGPDTNWNESLQNVDYVVHLAARVHVMDETSANPLQAFRYVNVEGTVNLARQAAAAGVRRFIYLSSIKVNGESTLPGKPFTESDQAGCTDPYAISKFEAEKELFALATETGVEVVIIRPPLVYGPGVKANFRNMMKWLKRGIPLPFGAIHNRRSLVALDNLVDLIRVCLKSSVAANQIFLAGDGEDLSTTELLQRLSKSLGAPSRLMPIHAKGLEIMALLVGKSAFSNRLCGSLQVDISKAKNLLGWKPVMNVEEALEKTAKAYLHERID